MDYAKFEAKFQELDNGKRMQSPALSQNAFENIGESRAYSIYAEERIFSNASPAEAQRAVEVNIKRYPNRYQ